MLLRHLLVEAEVESFRGEMELEIETVAYDSRKVTENCLFIAIQGFQTDGHHYIPQAIKNGAVAIVADRIVDVPAQITFVLVKNSRKALATISACWYGNPTQKLNIYGVTGTNGKTTTTWMIRSILAQCGTRTGLIGTICNFIQDECLKSSHTTPESYELQALFADMAKKEVSDVVMEVSSHALKLHRVHGVDFCCAVLTGIGRDHLDFHENDEDYVNTKRKLFVDNSSNKRLVINGDHRFRKYFSFPEALYFGFDEMNQIHAKNLRMSAKGSSFDLIIEDKKADVEIPIPGRYNILNALAAAGAVHRMGISIDQIALGLQNLTQVPGRFEKIDVNQPFHVIVDYAHTPDALEKVLETAREITQHQLIVVFGAGGDRDRGKRPLMGAVAEKLGDTIILTNDNPRSEEPEIIVSEILNGINQKEKVKVLFDRQKAIEHAMACAKTGDMVVIAGKGHEDYQIIKDQRLYFSDQDVVRNISKTYIEKN